MHLDELFEPMDQAVIATDVGGTIQHWNKAAERLYGWGAREVVGHNILDITPPPHERGRADAIMLRLQAGEAWTGIFPVRRRDGSTFMAVVTDSPVFDARGQLVGILGISSDFATRLQDLTPREYRVVQLLATGATNAEIARVLGWAEGTVRNAIARITLKLRVADRTQVALMAYRARLNAPENGGGSHL